LHTSGEARLKSAAFRTARLVEPLLFIVARMVRRNFAVITDIDLRAWAQICAGTCHICALAGNAKSAPGLSALCAATTAK
jgi:hypothetical protein